MLRDSSYSPDRMAKRAKKRKSCRVKASPAPAKNELCLEDEHVQGKVSPVSSALRAIGGEISSPVEDEATTQMLRWYGRDWFWGLILVLAVFLVYSPVWWAGFIWDDDVVVTANPVIVGPLGLKEIWTTSAADICPFTLTTFWVEHALWGLAPLPYHLVNVLMHGACAILFWQVLRSLQIPGAWLSAALWALHPVEVESVAWITEMKNTESGLLFLLAILFFVRNLRERHKWNDALILLFAALAMASKSSTVILPLVLCLCAWWVEGRWHWRNVVRVIPVFLMSVAVGIVSVWTERLQIVAIDDQQWTQTWPERLVTAGDAVWFYMGKLIWPHPLITIYPRGKIDAGQWISYLPLLATLGVLFILWLKRESWSRPWFFTFAYFLVALLPVLGLIDNGIFRYSLVFDHFQYLASMGLLALVGAGLVRFSDLVLPCKPRQRIIISGGLLLILGTLSWQRAQAYENQKTLWIDTVTKNPHCWLGYDELGNTLVRCGEVDEGIVQFQKALEIYPGYAEGHYNLGTAFFQKGRDDDAVDQFQKTLKINPSFIAAHNNLGFIFLRRGRVDRAIYHYQKALEINPNYAEIHYNLGLALIREGRTDEASAQFQEAIRLKPDFSAAIDRLAKAQGAR